MYGRTYHTKVLKQSEPPKKKRRRFSWKRFWWGVGIVAFIGGIVCLIRWPRLQVDRIEVVGTEVADPEDVSLFIKSRIEGSYLYFFPRSSMLLVPTASLSKWTARNFPRFSSVEVRRLGVRGLLVTVTEHKGAYLWCEHEASPCFFMTENGVVFAPAPFFSGDAYVRFFAGTRAEMPFMPLTEPQLALGRVLLERLPSIGITPSVLRWVSEHETEVVFSHYGSDATLLLDPANNIDETLEDLATGLATDPLKTKFLSKTNVLEYLDVRFANKVVYKFR